MSCTDTLADMQWLPDMLLYLLASCFDLGADSAGASGVAVLLNSAHDLYWHVWQTSDPCKACLGTA